MVELLVALAGGGTGLLGSLFGRVAGFFERKQKMKEKELDYAHELNVQALNMQEASQERESEERIVQSVQDTKVVTASYKHDASYGESLLRWVRPALTFILMILAAVVYLTMDDADKTQIGVQILYLTTLSVTWWFADRGRSK